MILTFDTETQGLGGEYITGSICYENEKTKTFNQKNELWNELLRQGEYEKKRGHHTTVYAHNLQYDFYTIWPKKMNGIKFKSTHPLIIEIYNQQNQHILTFMGTEALYPRMTLKEIGEKIGTKKIEPPNELWEKIKKYEKQTYDFTEINELNKYCQNDSLIVQKAIKYIKKKLNEEKIKPKRIISIAQLALCKYNKIVRETPGLKNKLCEWQQKGKYTLNYIKPKDFKFTIKGAREKRLQAFQTGYFKNCTEVDINSLYPYSATLIQYPNLQTEKIIQNPPKEDYRKIIKKIGITSCIIQKKEENIGSIPIRWQNQTCFPNQKSTLFGTWTNTELEWYQNLGHKIIKIEKTSTYETISENPLKQYMEYYYQKRIQNPNDNLFYKSMMNNLIGKLAQRKKWENYELINNYEIDKYLTREYQIMKPAGNNQIIIRNNQNEHIANHYHGIIPYMVWAKARQILYETGLTKIPTEDLLYCNTDSVVFKEDHLKKFSLSDKLGEYKIGKNLEGKQHKNVPCLIFGKGDMSIGNQIKLGGITKRNLKIENFITGHVETTKQLSIKTAKSIEEAGKFETKKIDLNETRQNYLDYQKQVDETEIFIDDYEGYNEIKNYQKEGYL